MANTFFLINPDIPKNEILIHVLNLDPKYLNLLKKSYEVKIDDYEALNTLPTFICRDHGLWPAEIEEIEILTQDGIIVLSEKDDSLSIDYSDVIDFTDEYECSSKIAQEVYTTIDSLFGSHIIIYNYEKFSINKNLNLFDYLKTECKDEHT